MFWSCLMCTDISQNKEFYMNADVRPPFTYASLIRQVSSPLVSFLNNWNCLHPTLAQLNPPFFLIFEHSLAITEISDDLLWLGHFSQGNCHQVHFMQPALRCQSIIAQPSNLGSQELIWAIHNCRPVICLRNGFCSPLHLHPQKENGRFVFKDFWN